MDAHAESRLHTAEYIAECEKQLKQVKVLLQLYSCTIGGHNWRAVNVMRDGAYLGELRLSEPPETWVRRLAVILQRKSWISHPEGP